MNNKFELGKDYIFRDGKILTCCNFDKAANCIDFVYKNNITPKDNIFGFDGHYIPFVNPNILGEYRNTYYTYIYDLAGKISSQLLSTDIIPEQVLSGEVLNMKLIISSSKEDGVIGEFWYDEFNEKFVQQIYPSIYVFKGIRDDKGNFYSFYDFNKLRKATITEVKQYLNKNKMKTNKEFELVDGEYYYCRTKCDQEWIYIYKSMEDNWKTNRYASFQQSDNSIYYGYGNGCITDNDDIQTIRLATQEEKDSLINRLAEEGRYFNKETKTIETIIKKQEIMETFTITRTDMQKIYDIACSTWKMIIMDLTTKYATSSFSDEVILPKEEVEKMFNAANPSQKKTLNEVFPEYSISKDKNIFIKGATSAQHRDLEIALKSLIPNHRVEMINNAGDLINRPDLKYRGLFVGSNIKVIVHERDDCSLIEFIEK